MYFTMELANVKNSGQVLTVTVARWHSGADGLALAVTYRPVALGVLAEASDLRPHFGHAAPLAALTFLAPVVTYIQKVCKEDGGDYEPVEAFEAPLDPADHRGSFRRAWFARTAKHGAQSTTRVAGGILGRGPN